MKLLKSRILRGCNVHHGSTVIRQDVDLAQLAGRRSGEAGPHFAERFLERFCELRKRVPESAMCEDFLERLRSASGAPFEEVLLEATLAVETAVAFEMRELAPIGFAGTVPTASPQKARLVWECRAPGRSRRAAAVGLLGVLELLPPELQSGGEGAPEDFKTAFAALEAQARRAQRSTTTAVLALAAKKRGLPYETIRGPHLRLGQGAAQRLIYASVTERTSLAASQLARNKHRTNRRLAQLHLPVTRQITVDTVEEAVDAAESLGYPVVIKPLKQKQAFGVSVAVRSPDDVPSAFERARKAHQRVIVESFVRGDAYRLLVVGGRFIAALKTIPPAVTGDGERTIAELVEELNRDPLRDGVHLYSVPVDDELVHDLRLSGYTLDHVPEKGKTLALRLAANVAIGGLHSDVTDSVHPDNQDMAIRAAKGIGLDVAGIDFVTEDISRSYKEAGGSIIEVNARPGLCMHSCPLHGTSRRAAGAVLDLLFPSGATGRIPIAVVSGGRNASRVARDLDALLQASGRTVALATRKSTLVNGRPAEIAKPRLRRAPAILLRDPRVESLVASVSLRRAMKRGLGLESCDVAAIVERASDRAAGTDTQRGLDVIARATRGILAVSADNQAALQVLNGLDPKRLILTGSDPKDLVIARHVAAGGAVVLHVREGDQHWIVLYCGGKVVVSIRVETPAGERISARRMEARMFTVALAFGIGLSASELEAAVSSARPVSRPSKRSIPVAQSA
jgi:cyanophycin synthetase